MALAAVLLRASKKSRPVRDFDETNVTDVHTTTISWHECVYYIIMMAQLSMHSFDLQCAMKNFRSSKYNSAISLAHVRA